MIDDGTGVLTAVDASFNRKRGVPTIGILFLRLTATRNPWGYRVMNKTYIHSNF